MTTIAQGESTRETTPAVWRSARGIARPVALTALIDWPVVIAFGLTTAFYLITFGIVRDHYAVQLPHYDSIGSYLYMFNVMNVAEQQGFEAGAAAARLWSISWLHPFYALLLSWTSLRLPEWLVSLNFVLLFVAQLCIVHSLRAFGLSALHQVSLSMLPVLPGVLYVWDGGLQDLRRDPQMIVLLTGLAFLGLAYVYHPSWRKGVAVGLVMGFTQWSRDNALSMIAIILLPAVAIGLADVWRRRDWLKAVRLAWLPLLVFAVVAVPYYRATLGITFFRYQYVVWGIGEDRLASLQTFWHAPLDLFFGGLPLGARLGAGSDVGWSTFAYVLACCVALGVLLALSAIRLRPARLVRQPGLSLIASGVFINVAVVLYTTIGLGYGPQFHTWPFAPAVIGSLLIIAGCSTGIERWSVAGWRRGVVLATLSAFLVAALPLGQYRMRATDRPPVGAAEVAATSDAAAHISGIVGQRSIALLWVFGFSRHHINFYNGERGVRPMVQFEGVATGSGQYVDLEQPLKPTDDPAQLRSMLDRSIRTFADFVFVCEDTSKYEDERESLWPFRVGKPVVDTILHDPAFVPVAHFTLSGLPFVLLENRSSNRLGATGR
jgi:hypothetical protein